MNGLTVGNFFEQQKVFDVVVVGTPRVRSSVTSVNNLLIDTVNGGHARLGSLAQVSVAAEPDDITHDQMSPYVDVTAALSGRSLSSASAAVAAGLSRISFPLGYYAVVQGPASPAFTGARLASYVDRGADRHPPARPGRDRQLAAGADRAGRAAGPGRRRGAHRVRASASRTRSPRPPGCSAVLAIAIQQAFRMTAAIRRAHRATAGS